MCELQEAANELWHKDSKNLLIENSDGFQIELVLIPQINCATAFDGAFDISEDQMTQLMEILEEP